MRVFRISKLSGLFLMVVGCAEMPQDDSEWSSVELLSLISEPLRMELHFELRAPLLDGHAFFNLYVL